MRIGLVLWTLFFVANVIACEAAKVAGLTGKSLALLRLLSLSVDWAVPGIPLGSIILFLFALVFYPAAGLHAFRAATATFKEQLASIKQ